MPQYSTKISKLVVLTLVFPLSCNFVEGFKRVKKQAEKITEESDRRQEELEKQAAIPKAFRGDFWDKELALKKYTKGYGDIVEEKWACSDERSTITISSTSLTFWTSSEVPKTNPSVRQKKAFDISTEQPYIDEHGEIPCSKKETLTKLKGIFEDGVFKPAELNMHSGITIEDMGDYLLITGSTGMFGIRQGTKDVSLKAYKKKPELRAKGLVNKTLSLDADVLNKSPMAGDVKEAAFPGKGKPLKGAAFPGKK